MGGKTIHIDEKLVEGVYIRAASSVRNIYSVYTVHGQIIGRYCYYESLRGGAVLYDTGVSGNLSLLEQRVKDLIAIEEL